MYRWLIVLMLFLFSCSDDSNPVTNEYRVGDTIEETPIPCCVTPEDVNLMMADEQEDNDLPWPMIVGGEEVNPECPDCKYPFMVSLQSTSKIRLGCQLLRNFHNVKKKLNK